MIQSAARTARDSVARLGLADAAFWLYGNASRLLPWSAASNARLRRNGAPDGLPIPPPELIYLVAGTADVGWFLRGGELAALSIRDALATHGADIDALGALLDFGCGCGRVIRNWNSLRHTDVHGSDYNSRLIAWCRQNLGFARFETNALSPPLPYRDGQFGLAYALSVFTHLTVDLQDAWMAELRRVVRAGGYVVVSLHGDAYAHRLTAAERRVYLGGNVVVKNNVRSPGSNTCSAYHPEAYVRSRLAIGFEVVDFIREGARGNPRQDLYVLRKPAA